MKTKKVLIAAGALVVVAAVALGILLPKIAGRPKTAAEIEKITIYVQPSLYPNCFVFHLTPDRTLVRELYDWEYEYFKDPPQTPVSSSETVLTAQQYDRLVQAIRDNRFSSLPAEIHNRDILDGFMLYMAVVEDGETHVVGGYMPQEENDRFNNIYQNFIELIDLYSI